MDINYFELIVGSIVLLLGLKGILNGFFKEFFGLIGIVGGVFIASRLASNIGQILSDNLFHFQNSAAVNFTGFLVVLIAFWLMMIAVGMMLKKLTALSGLGVFDRILGFVFGAGKFFLIFSIIAYAVYNVKTIRENLKKPMQNSILFPIMVQTGSYIMKLDPVGKSEELKEKAKELQDSLQKKAQESINKELEKKADEIKEQLKEAIPQDINGA